MDEQTVVLPQNGHTLLELILAVSILALLLVLPCVTVVRGLQVVEARTSAQSWQLAAAQAQVAAAWEGSVGRVLATPVSITSGDPRERLSLGMSSPALAVGSNVARWERDGGVAVTFAQGFGSPDGAGTITFGDTGWGAKVVVRIESGSNRRARQ